MKAVFLGLTFLLLTFAPALIGEVRMGVIKLLEGRFWPVKESWPVGGVLNEGQRRPGRLDALQESLLLCF